MEQQPQLILVTAASGNIGRYVVQSLLQTSDSIRVRATVHDLSKVEFIKKLAQNQQQEERIEVQTGFDPSNEEALTKAVQGASGIFLNYPDFGVDKVKATELLLKVVNDVHKEKKPLLVRIAVGNDPSFNLGEEYAKSIIGSQGEAIRKVHSESDVPYVLLLPGWFHQNFITFYGAFIKHGSSIPLPTGNAILPHLDTRDIGQVTANIFLNKVEYKVNSSYWLANASYSYTQIAEAISAAVGRTIQYVDTDGPLKEYYSTQPAEIAEEMLKFYSFEKSISGKLPSDPATLTQLLGRTPIPFSQFVSENVAHWKN